MCFERIDLFYLCPLKIELISFEGVSNFKKVNLFSTNLYIVLIVVRLLYNWVIKEAELELCP